MPPKKNIRLSQEKSPNKASNNEFECPVCMEIPTMAMLTDACGHLLCELCTHELLKKNDDAQCPICNTGFTKDSIRHSLFAQRQIDALPAQCPSEGCEWLLARSELGAHLKRCPFATITCPHGCEGMMKGRDLDAHEAECPEITVDCSNQMDGCQEHMKRKDANEHLLVCPYQTIPCTNEGCSVTMLRQDAAKHQKECPEAVVKCPHAEDGCEVVMKRMLLGEHMEANKFEHLQLQVVAMKAQHKREIKELKETHKRSLVGERRVVSVPLTDDGFATFSNACIMFGEVWHVVNRTGGDFCTLQLIIDGSTKEYEGHFSLTLLSAVDDVPDVTRSTHDEGHGFDCHEFHFVKKQELHKHHVKNDRIYVGVWMPKVPNVRLC